MKYEVIVKEFEIYNIQIDADSEQEAQKLADEVMESGKKHEHHDDSGAEIQVFEIFK